MNRFEPDVICIKSVISKKKVTDTVDITMQSMGEKTDFINDISGSHIFISLVNESPQLNISQTNIEIMYPLTPKWGTRK